MSDDREWARHVVESTKERPILATIVEQVAEKLTLAVGDIHEHWNLIHKNSRTTEAVWMAETTD